MKPKILAIETSTDACSAAVLASDGKIFSRFLVAPRQHARLILPMIQEVLTEANLTLKDLTAIAFGCGPGSFTGLRVACGTAQGLAFGADLPVIAVSSLQILAQGIYEENAVEKALVGIDAKMQEIYFGAYQLGANDLMQPEIPDSLCTPDKLPITSGNDWIGVGDAWKEYITQFATVPYFYPKACHALKLARSYYQSGKILSANQAKPIYLRGEKAWQKK